MAKEPSVGDNIRGKVSRLLDSELKKTPVKPHVQMLKSLSAADRNSRLLQASAAIYRATKDKTSKPTPQQIKDYAAAIDIIAEKRGIKPSNDGKFSDENLKRELAPAELMKIFAAQTLKDHDDEQAARDQISQDLKQVYGEEQLPEEVENIKQVSASQANFCDKSDAEFLSLSEDQQNEYLAGLNDLDKERLQELLKKHQRDLDRELEKNAARINGQRDDPDWAKDDDNDDFKIEQGDIIEYLMKDIILASAAWAGNKIAGGAGILVYEAGSGIYRHALRPGWRTTKEFFSDTWKNVKNNLFNRDDPQENDAADRFENIIATYEQQAQNSQEHLDDFEKEAKKIQAFSNYLTRFINNQAVINDQGIITGGKLRKFEDIKPSNPEEVRQFFTTFRDNIRKEQENDLKNRFPEEQAEIEKWLEKQYAYEEDVVKTKGNPTLSKPQNDKYSEALTNARIKQSLRQENIISLEVLKEQSNLFANHYAVYKLTELCRQNPKDNILCNDEKCLDFMKNAELEARMIFWTAEKQRREGKDVLSREALIAEAKNLVEESQNKSKNKKDKNPIVDTKLKTIIGQTTVSEENTQTLMTEYNKADPAELYAAEMFNIDALEREQRLRKEDCNTRREKLEKTRKNIQNQSGQDISKTYNDLRNTNRGR